MATTHAYPPELTELRALMTNETKLALDLWVYESFNGTYKPSDWTRNPSSDDKLLSFAKDGVGGQVLIWLRAPEPNLLQLPIAFLGRDGEVAVVARDFYDFGELLAAGVSAYSVATDAIPAAPKSEPAVTRWVKERLGRSPAAAPTEIARRARELLPEFQTVVVAEREAANSK